MDDKRFELYKSQVHEQLKIVDKSIIPQAWWDTVIKYYFNQGYSRNQAVQHILELLDTQSSQHSPE